MISLGPEMTARLTDAAYHVIRMVHTTAKDDNDFTDAMMDRHAAEQIAKAVMQEYGKPQKPSEGR